MSAPRARRIGQYLALLNADRARGLAGHDLDGLAAACIGAGRDLGMEEYLAAVGEIARVAPADFALRFGASRRLADMGMVGHAIMSCETLRQAFGFWVNHASLAGDPFTYTARVDDGVWSVELYPNGRIPPALVRFFAEEWAATFCRFAAETTGADCHEAGIAFRHAAKDGVDYAAFLPVIPRFGCARNGLSMPVAFLDSLVVSRDDEMFDLLQQHFARQRPEIAPAGTAAQLRRLFFTSAGHVPTLAEAAAMLGLSGRTLNRRLAGEATTYAAVLGAYRADYAQALAAEGTLGAKQIAHAVGYRSHQSLRRCFSAWTGQPLGAWRARRHPRA